MSDQQPLVLVDVRGDHVGQPQHLAAPLVPVPRKPEPPKVVVLQHNRVDAVLLAFLQRHEDPLFGVVLRGKTANVEQISCMHVHADQVAAAD